MRERRGMCEGAGVGRGRSVAGCVKSDSVPGSGLGDVRAACHVF